MVGVGIDFKRLVPNRQLFFTALYVGIVTTLVLFLLDFFGLKGLFNFIPDGFQLLFLVAVSVYISSVVVIKK